MHSIIMILQHIFDDIESHNLHISEQPDEFADPYCEGAAMTHEFRNRIVLLESLDDVWRF